jgi:hypothetical protein
LTGEELENRDGFQQLSTNNGYVSTNNGYVSTTFNNFQQLSTTFNNFQQLSTNVTTLKIPSKPGKKAQIRQKSG